MRRFRKKNRQLPVSFFAFQDIISALSGTLLIIVLLAAYNRNQPPAENSTYVSRQEFELLEKQLELRQDELTSAGKSLKKLRSQQNRVLNDSRMPTVNLQYTAALHEVSASLAEWEVIRKKLTAEISAVRQELDRADPAVRDLLARAVRLDELKTEIKAGKNTFKLDDTGQEELIILDCARGRWLWSDRRHKKVQLGSGDPSPQGALDELRRRLHEIDAPRVRLVMAVRPSAGKFAQALKELLVREFPSVQIICEPLVSEKSGGFEL